MIPFESQAIPIQYAAAINGGIFLDYLDMLTEPLSPEMEETVNTLLQEVLDRLSSFSANAPVDSPVHDGQRGLDSALENTVLRIRQRFGIAES